MSAVTFLRDWKCSLRIRETSSVLCNNILDDSLFWFPPCSWKRVAVGGWGWGWVGGGRGGGGGGGGVGGRGGREIGAEWGF